MKKALKSFKIVILSNYKKSPRLLKPREEPEEVMEVNQNTQEKWQSCFDSFDEEHRALEEKAKPFCWENWRTH